MKVHLPWIGKAAGSSANMIFQSYWGKTYSRSFPSSFHYPDTPAQQECQARFHDLRRVWEFAYLQFKPYIPKSQRRNRNTYDNYMADIFKVVNPYQHPSLQTPPASFGLDRYNRMRASMHITEAYFWGSRFNVRWDSWQISNNIASTPNSRFFLVVNKTQQNLSLLIDDAPVWLDAMSIYNAYGWQKGDEFLFYVALSSNSWMGNFNLCD